MKKNDERGSPDDNPKQIFLIKDTAVRNGPH
jgi:hypothetical protein